MAGSVPGAALVAKDNGSPLAVKHFVWAIRFGLFMPIGTTGLNFFDWNPDLAAYQPLGLFQEKYGQNEAVMCR